MRRRKKKNETVGLIFAIIALFLIVKIISDKTFLEGIISLIGIAIFGLLLIVVVIFGYRLNRRAKIKMKLLAAGSDNPMQLTPNQYEEFCAALLENNGWSTQVTSRSSDYGADIIATKGSVRIVVQCKQWSGSVGVKAVQEVHTAISYYNANKAIVITTSKYTHAAKKLAASTGVSLLTHEDLAKDC
ncbi:restriction endonuclease [Acidithiobacillus ferriphilus]|uniref:restriction endonuclease n=1 Tax=Acidithiobacillus ferriphilus TaxID=1689834 RepID=UPI00242D330B|nr:restriction endonuclease [Acidithiobacillus ferriphilus]